MPAANNRGGRGAARRKSRLATGASAADDLHDDGELDRRVLRTSGAVGRIPSASKTLCSRQRAKLPPDLHGGPNVHHHAQPLHRSQGAGATGANKIANDYAIASIRSENYHTTMPMHH